jgi:hypothetical protein
MVEKVPAIAAAGELPGSPLSPRRDLADASPGVAALAYARSGAAERGA